MYKHQNFISRFLLSLIFIAAMACSTSETDKSNEGQDFTSEFQVRKQMAIHRLTGTAIQPVFSDAFILADVDLNPDNPRRFYNFSGDLSGRYVEAIAALQDEKHESRLHRLVEEILQNQKTDGRFGDDQLRYIAEEIDGEHMALLWGNGRMLVGLLTYYQYYGGDEVLKAAQKLGDFFITTYNASAQPALREKLRGYGAKGIICFTQYIEGLVMLSEASGEDTYARYAENTYQILPERGIQHTHGYLSTLRGVLMLYSYFNEPRHLQFVENAMNDLLASDDYTSFFSVREYFGKGYGGDRDEGCSTADFMLLCFELYQHTGRKHFLNAGEKALYNAFYFNQYPSGDFGHHDLSPIGSKATHSMAAWWCCTMHGLRAMQKLVQKHMVRTQANRKYLELFLEDTYDDNALSVKVQSASNPDNTQHYSIDILNAEAGLELFIRIPDWSKSTLLRKRGQAIESTPDNGYIAIGEVKNGDRINLIMELERYYAGADKALRNEHSLDKLPLRAMFMKGPRIMGVDAAIDPQFNAEPSNHLVLFPDMEGPDPSKFNPKRSFMPGYYTTASYIPGGYPAYLQTVFRPISELTFDRRDHMIMRMDFTNEENARSRISASVLSPWMPD
ncbi:MAG: glycoside hydrolase family 127 protein [Cyclobacteriaceae bacterium]|nr:glycoside hydrolase family 127 protein [Cyclobacteriaceae bacterium]